MTKEEEYIQNDIEITLKAADEYNKWKNTYHSLVIENENLIYHVIKKLGLYSYRWVDELYDIGMIGLCKAARHYNSELGIKFSSYAVSCIRHEIHNYGKKKQNRIWFNLISLDTETNEDDTTAVNLIPDDINIDNSVIKKEMYEKLYKAIDELNDIEKFVINHTFELNGCKKITQGYMLNVIYKKFGVKYRRQRSISQIKHRALKKLYKKLKMEDYYG